MVARYDLDGGKLRQLCIDLNYYTCGTCEEYQNLFDMASEIRGFNEYLTEEKVVEVLGKLAEDIVQHSDPEDADEDSFAFIMSAIDNKCITRFYEKEA